MIIKPKLDGSYILPVAHEYKSYGWMFPKLLNTAIREILRKLPLPLIGYKK